MTIDYLDRGKTRLDVPGNLAGEIGKVMRNITKTSYRAEKARRRAGGAYSYYIPKYDGYLKDEVFEVLEEAIHKATAGGTYSVSARDLFYEVRPLIANTGKELKYNYFSQTLIQQYEEDYGSIPGLYRDPRGTLHEPHTDKSIPLGTIQVAEYQFPEFVYNKILYIEKEGVVDQLNPSKLAERYDMAIIGGKGYATEACRTLLERAEGGEYYIYVLHDADPYGYNIAYTLSEETRRMPGYYVHVEDIGLKVGEAVEMGLPSEPFNRTKRIPWRVEQRLTPLEEEYFIGTRTSIRSWQCKRIEINAIPVPDRAAYIERKLKELDAPSKVIPPDDKLPDLTEELYESKVGSKVDDFIESILSIDDLKEMISQEFKDKVSFEEARQWIEDGFKEDDSQWWRTVVRNKLEILLSDSHDDMNSRVKEEILKNAKED